MAIARIPIVNKNIYDKKAEDFINGAIKKPNEKLVTKTVVNIKVDALLLRKIDEAASNMGINRTAWLHVASNEKLRREDNGDY